MEEAFSQAGLALFEIMLDTKNVHPKTSEEIQTSGHDEKELLYNYLEELLLLFEVKQLALGDFAVSSITPTQGEIRLKGKTSGEPYERAKHNGKVEVKGITYHLMEIEKHPAKVTVKFLLDL
jgi:SHS2 domain-containing protein